jgi:hypothetical protein
MTGCLFDGSLPKFLAISATLLYDTFQRSKSDAEYESANSSEDENYGSSVKSLYTFGTLQTATEKNERPVRRNHSRVVNGKTKTPSKSPKGSLGLETLRFPGR